MSNLVFIVEDNPVEQKVLKIHFEQLLGNYTVRTFFKPEEMFAHLKDKPFAVVLDHFFSDRKDITGLHYLKELKKTDPSIPVIYYTSLNDDRVRGEVMSLGAEEYIIKNSASLVRLRTVLDLLHAKVSKKGFFQKLLNF